MYKLFEGWRLDTINQLGVLFIHVVLQHTLLCEVFSNLYSFCIDYSDWNGIVSWVFTDELLDLTLVED